MDHVAPFATFLEPEDVVEYRGQKGCFYSNFRVLRRATERETPAESLQLLAQHKS
jgi:hypothetical protein